MAEFNQSTVEGAVTVTLTVHYESDIRNTFHPICRVNYSHTYSLLWMAQLQSHSQSTVKGIFTVIFTFTVQGRVIVTLTVHW